MKTYKNVFIDLDDTLWDFHANAKSSLEEIFEERKLSRYIDNFEKFFEIYSRRNLELWDEYGRREITKGFLMVERFRFPLAQVGVDNTELAIEIGNQYLDLLPTRKTLLPFATELLDYLYPKYPLTIISNGFVEVQHRKMSACGIEHYFNHVVLSEAAGALKPDKQIFEHALKLNNATAANTIMIGDSYEADIIGARNAGIDQVFLSPNSSDPDKTATYKIKSLEEVFSIL